jgi:hypothetical protein
VIYGLHDLDHRTDHLVRIHRRDGRLRVQGLLEMALTPENYRYWHEELTTWLLMHDRRMDLLGARTYAAQCLDSKVFPAGFYYEDAQDNRDRLREEHQITDADLDGWLNRRQGSGSQL